MDNFCPDHWTVLQPYVFDARIARNGVEPYDFFAVACVQARGRTYYHDFQPWYVSRKVLDLLLEHRVPLRWATVRLREKSVPMLLSE